MSSFIVPLIVEKKKGEKHPADR